MARNHHLFATAGGMGARIRDHDWARAGLGDMADWSPALWSVLGVCLHSSIPSAIYWGDELRLIYNDAWAPIVGERHPWGLGRPAHTVWPDIWHIIEPRLAHVRERCAGLATRDELLPIARDGTVEDSYWDYSFSPITEADGSIAGIFNQGHETTARVQSERHDALQAALGDAMRGLETTGDILAATLPLIGTALGVSRAGFSALDAAHDLTHVERTWTDGTLPEHIGTKPLAAFGPAMLDTFATGEPYCVEDAFSDARLDAAQRAFHADLGVRARLVIPVLHEGRPVAALFAHDRLPRRWSPHQRAVAASAAQRVWQQMARARAETALRDSAERHRLIFEQTDAILFSTDLEGRITTCNPATARALGRSAGELALRPLAELIDAEGYRTLAAAMAEAQRGGGTASADLTIAREGQVCHLEATASPAIDRDGKAIGFHAVARDVTLRRQGERRQQRLINELNHRVKNTLALVQGLALQSFRDERPLGCEREAFQRRLGALAAVHDLLTRGHWEGASLAALVADAVRAIGAPERVAMSGPEVMLAPKVAISLALALHELAVNACSYGALAAPDGRVTIGWTTDEARLRLDWREAGGARVTAPARLGFGLRMAERALATDFRGTVRLDFAEAGFGLALDAPLPTAGDAAGAT